MSQELITFFDEFEKVYEKESIQNELLTLLDGTCPVKMLAIFTINDAFKLVKPLKNRPGRVYYHIEFAGLSQEFIQEYAADNLINKAFVPALIHMSPVYRALNFDMLKALVEECNRYNESPRDVIRLLNAKPDGGGSNLDYTIIWPAKWNGFDVPVEKNLKHVEGCPLLNRIRLYVYYNKPDKPDGQDNELLDEIEQSIDFSLTPEDLVNYEPLSKTYTYKIQGNIIQLRERVKTDMVARYLDAAF